MENEVKDKGFSKTVSLENLSTFENEQGKIYVLGTAHVSKISSQETEELIEAIKPDCLALELDLSRYNAILDTDENKKWKNLDIYEVLRSGKVFLVIIQIILSSFQKRLAKEQGISPGEEMKTGILKAIQNNIPLILVDRPVEVTLKRAWRQTSVWEKSKILSCLFSFSSHGNKITAEEIEKLKEKDMLLSMIEELAKEVPNVKKVLIDERDEYIAGKILEGQGNKILAIVGAGHVNGIIDNLTKLKSKTKIINLVSLNEIPKNTFTLGKLLSWLFPILVVSLIGFGFYFKGFDVVLHNIKLWIFVNSVPAALMGILLRANFLTVLSAFIIAPITSLIPFIGTGVVAGLVEAYINKPIVKDFENLSDDLGNIKGYFNNRITKILLIALAINFGSAIGSIVGLKFLLNIIN